MATDKDCLFCRIVAGEMPAQTVYSDEEVIAIRDIAPKAPVHVLVLPRGHFTDVADLATDAGQSSAVLRGVAAIARQFDLPYFTTIFNTGRESGQTVFHVHAHVLSGSGMMWAHGA
jgi:histidine triad (HIT) family protein